MPSFILIHPTIWPQYTNVTDRTRQTGQRSDSIGRTVLQTVAQKMNELAVAVLVVITLISTTITPQPFTALYPGTPGELVPEENF